MRLLRLTIFTIPMIELHWVLPKDFREERKGILKLKKKLCSSTTMERKPTGSLYLFVSIMQWVGI